MKRVLVFLVMLCLVICSPFMVCAAEDGEEVSTNKNNEPAYGIMVEDELGISEMNVVSETERVVDGRKIVEKVYQDSNGITITDRLEMSANGIRTANGTDTVTRYRSISGFGTVYLKATFQWKEEGLFSYVKCNSMSAWKGLEQGIISADNKWTTDYTKEYKALGSAKAEVTYHFYKKNRPTVYTAGCFVIYCSDTGNISDNG